MGVEFINEWFSNLLAAVLPAVRSALGLNYVQVSFLFTLLEGTDVLSDGIFGVIGDVWSRRVLITSGTIVAGFGLILMGVASGYLVLMLGVILYGFAGGPFVGLSQASLVDTAPGKHEEMMAWWMLAGDVGFLLTPLMVAVAYAFGVDWRVLFLAGGGLFLVYAFFLAGVRIPRQGMTTEGAEVEVEATVSSNLAAIRAAALDPGLLRWALILPLLEMPVKAFVVLYFHDVVGFNDALASSTLIVIIGSSLVGRVLLPWVLRFVRGVLLLRLSVWLGVVSFALFLLVPFVPVKLVMLALFSLVEADWYPLAKGQAYAAQPTKSGVVLSVTSLLSPITSFLPLLVGVIASQAGLGWGMGVLLVGPLVAAVLLCREY